MQPLRRVVLGLALASAISLTGCRGVEAPYPPGKPPEVAALLAATAPVLSSVQVPRAKVRQGAGPAANLMLAAQAPARFAGTIQVSGNELVSLAVNEDEYGLRWLGGRDEGLSPGYYSGPPSRCAVETLLGVDLEPEKLVELVLGGAPMIDEPYEVLDRGWERKTGRERLVIANDRYRQELRFAWVDGGWQFAGASLFALGSGGGETWLWTISHEELHEVRGATLPAKTQIRRPKPNGRGDTVLTVSFQRQIPNPGFGDELPEDPPIPGEGEEPPPVNAGDTWEDDWGDDEGWETADGSGEPVAERPGAASGSGSPGSGPAKAEIPPQFRGNPTGLTPRGDLCAGRR